MGDRHQDGERLQAAVTAFLKGVGTVSKVQAAVEAHTSTRVQAQVLVGRTAKGWKRLAQLHNASFGEALFALIYVGSTFGLLWRPCVACGCSWAGGIGCVTLADAVTGTAAKISRAVEKLAKLQHVAVRRTLVGGRSQRYCRSSRVLVVWCSEEVVP